VLSQKQFFLACFRNEKDLRKVSDRYDLKLSLFKNISDDGYAHYEIHDFWPLHDLNDFCKASISLPSYELRYN